MKRIDFERIFDNIRRDQTMVHCITNYVTINDVANMILAIGASPIMADDWMEVREITAAEEKQRIARYAAAQVNDDDFVFIDAGTTTLLMAEYLTNSKATFVTTGIECARRLVEKGLRVYVPGGLLKPGTQALVGAAALVLAEGFPRQLIAIFGAANESSYYTDFAIKAFRTYLCMMILACVNKACFIFLQAVGKALSSTLLSMFREVVFGVGFALLLPVFFGLDGVLYSMPVSDILTFIISAIIIMKTYRELNVEGVQNA